MINARPTPIRPQIDSWTSLSSWLDKRLENIESDLGEGEVLQSIGVDARIRLTGRRSELLDTAWAIGPQVAAEQAERQQVAAEESQETAWRDSAASGAGGSVEAYRG